MPTHRFPVLIWEDHAGAFTAALIEAGARVAAVGETAAAALLQIKEYLAWSFKEHPWRDAPEFHDARLTELRVQVRPEYHTERSVFPCEETLALRVACVHGRDESGLLIGALPLLGLYFYYHEPKALKDLVTHYVQERLKGLTPAELAEFLPPRSVTLDEVVVNVQPKPYQARHRPHCETLDAVAEPLGAHGLRRGFARAWEREREVQELVKRLSRERANVLLVGEAGVGKTTVLAEAVRQIERELADRERDESDGGRHKFHLTSAARLIAGMQYLGQWQARCEQVIEELTAIDGVLCVDNLLDLLRVGCREPAESPAMFFLPYLQRGELRLVAEVTPTELNACRRLLPGLADLFQILPLPPFTPIQALTTLDRAAANLARDLKLEFAAGVTETIHHLFRRFHPSQAFPGRSAAFLRELADRAVRAHAPEVTSAQVVEYFVRQTGLPEQFLRDEMTLAYAAVEDHFSARIIGQSAACGAAARLVTTFKAGLNDPQRPVGVLLFCGPTGVGKTELARALAQYFFGHGAERDSLVRLDMSEYAGWGAAERLLTAPDGEPSALLKSVRRRPFTVILLDEIEKADAEVFDVLLSVFDEGRLTDRYGRTTSFRSAVIILTSNLGADKLGGIGFGDAPPPSYTAEAMAFFRPEFYNRLDAVVQFNPLDRTMMLAITRKEMGELAAREGLLKNNLRLAWPDELIEHLARVGFDPRYGARPLQRTIETLVVAPLARRLVANPALRDATIHLALNEQGEVTFHPQI